jgi:secreted trypsin-like serine protease
MGGVDTTIEAFPHIVTMRLFSTTTFFCSGSIITNKHLLTAAHCVMDVHFVNLWIIMGSTELIGTNGVSYFIQKIDLHPQFEGLTVGTQPSHNDIAVLTVT